MIHDDALLLWEISVKIQVISARFGQVFSWPNLPSDKNCTD